MSLWLMNDAEATTGAISVTQYNRARDFNAAYATAISSPGAAPIEVIMNRHQWKWYEPTANTYDFTLLDKHVAAAGSRGLRVGIMIHTKLFRMVPANGGDANPQATYSNFLPPDLDPGWLDMTGKNLVNATYAYATGGAKNAVVYVAKIWVPGLAARYKALIDAFVAHCGCDGTVAFLCSTESSLASITPPDYPGGDGYAAALLDLATYAANKMACRTKMRMGLSINWLPPMNVGAAVLNPLYNGFGTSLAAANGALYETDFHIPGQVGQYSYVDNQYSKFSANARIGMVSGDVIRDTGWTPTISYDRAASVGLGHLGLYQSAGAGADLLTDWLTPLTTDAGASTRRSALYMTTRGLWP